MTPTSSGSTGRTTPGLEFFFYGVGCVPLGDRLRHLHPQHHPAASTSRCRSSPAAATSPGSSSGASSASNNMGMLFQAANYVWFFLDAGFIFTYGVLVLRRQAAHDAAAAEASESSSRCAWYRRHGRRHGHLLPAQPGPRQRGRRTLRLPDSAVDLVPLHPADAAADDPAATSRSPPTGRARWARRWSSCSSSCTIPSDYFLLTIGTASAIIDGDLPLPVRTETAPARRAGERQSGARMRASSSRAAPRSGVSNPSANEL